MRLSPLLFLVLPVLYLFKKRIRVPEFVKSGMALAIASGAALLIFLLVFLVAMYDLAQLLAASV